MFLIGIIRRTAAVPQPFPVLSASQVLMDGSN